MSQYDNTDRGVLFKNKEKKQDTHADYQGNINVAGQEYWLNAWVKKDKNGNPFMSLSVKLKQQPGIAPPPTSQKAQQQRQTPAPANRGGFEDMEDDVPFRDPLTRALSLAM